MKELDSDTIADVLAPLISSVRAIAYGESVPTGLEAVTMALAGEGHPGHDSITASIREVGEAVERAGTAVERGLYAVASALEGAIAHALGGMALRD